MELDGTSRLRVAFAQQPDVRIVASPLAVSEFYLRLALTAHTGVDGSAAAQRALRRVEAVVPRRALARLAPIFGAMWSAGAAPVPLPTGHATIEDELAYSAPLAPAAFRADVAALPRGMTHHLWELVADPEPVTRLLLSASLRVWVRVVGVEWPRILGEIRDLRLRHAAVAAELGWLDTLALLNADFCVSDAELDLNMWLTEPRLVTANPAPVLVMPTFGDARGVTATPTALQLLVPGLRPLGDPYHETPPAALPPRLRVLAALDSPASTTDLAVALDRSPGAVSELLTALHTDALVERQRQGRRVLYRRSDRGDAVLAAMVGSGG